MFFAEELVGIMYESLWSLSQRREGKADAKRRKTDLFVNNFIENCLHEIFSQNMKVARFLHDLADIEKIDEDNELFHKSIICVSSDKNLRTEKKVFVR